MGPINKITKNIRKTVAGSKYTAIGILGIALTVPLTLLMERTQAQSPNKCVVRINKPNDGARVQSIENFRAARVI
jgi:hypothetical protein